MIKLSNGLKQVLFIGIAFVLLYISLYVVLHIFPEQCLKITPELCLDYTSMVVLIGFLIVLAMKRPVLGVAPLLFLIYVTIWNHWLLLFIPTYIVMCKIMFRPKECNQYSVRPYLYVATAIFAMSANEIHLEGDRMDVFIVLFIIAVFWLCSSIKIPKDVEQEEHYEPKRGR
jgi:hypothetical protein